MQTENWLPVVGYEERYRVSDHGRVMSINYRNTGTQRLMKPGKDTYGYLQVCLQKGSKQVTKKVHAIVMEAFVGPRPPRHDINHRSGVKTENTLANLEYCTSSENRLHAYRLGAQPRMRGEAHPNSKLDEEQVRAIRKWLAAGQSQTSLAKVFNVHQTTISLIASGKRWHLQP